ncbi:MAG TPA: DUF4118 domain-containing protein [Acidimicrobiales bacterium]|nr:DUF4118 domain-containing protein [Acidimicrobiales bacterium]
MDVRGALVRRSTVAVLRCGAPAAAALALSPLRGTVSNADAALVIVAAVALAGVSGRRLTSVVGAVGGAAAFAVLWATPEGAARVDRGADLVAAVMILAVGVLLAELVRRNRSAGPAPALRSRRWPMVLRRPRLPLGPLRSVGRVAQEVADGDDAEFILLDVARTLVELLDLDDCRYETAPLADASRATLVHGGELELQQLRWTPMQLGLPERGFDLLVEARGQTLGRFVCSPRHRRTISEDRVLAALALVDQAASARLIASVT